MADMAKALDKARAAWGQAAVLQGGGTGGPWQGAKELGRLLVQRIIDGAGRVRMGTLADLQHALAELGFAKVNESEWNPPGRQIFYQSGHVVVRVKTKGDKPSPRNFPRENRAHLSVSLTDGKGLEWMNDLGKFNAAGRLAPKAITPVDRFQPTDFQGNPQKFVLLMGGKYTGIHPDAWADSTHFFFPVDTLT
ncbi:MAG TPA: hypothetical protein DEH78_14165 [Solibacterales bacterium]|nr:hypothetical protein [Bryobacterales bacterium]